MTDQPKSVLGAPRTEENDQRLRDSLEAIRAAERGDQPETITVPVEVLRRLHEQATANAWEQGYKDGRVGSPLPRSVDAGLAWWPTFPRYLAGFAYRSLTSQEDR